MRIGDTLFFAPHVPFSAIRPDDPHLARYWSLRIDGFYLQPAREAADAGHAFAAGLLAVCAVDALASASLGGNTGRRFQAFAGEFLPSFAEPIKAKALYRFFRNGLVHEGRIKAAAEFSLEQIPTIGSTQGIWRINPRELTREIGECLPRLEVTASAVARLVAMIATEFSVEMLSLS